LDNDVKLFQQERKAVTINGNNMESQPLPAIDFRTETVLVIYLRNRSERPGKNSFIVDKNGDLTFQPPLVAKAWHSNLCSMLLAEIYRSGVKSIEGMPLPPSELKQEF
jgi:hypothetical protein